MKKVAVLALFILPMLFQGIAFSGDHKVTFSEKGVMSNDDETPNIDLNKLYFDYDGVSDEVKFLVGKVYYSQFTHPHYSMEPYPGLKGARMYVLFCREIARTFHLYVSVASRSGRGTYPIQCSLDDMICTSRAMTWRLSFKGNKFELHANDGWGATFEEVGALPPSRMKPNE